MSVFGHGQLRLYLLRLLMDGPRHGYDIIRDLESRFSGLYSPSAGTVYPRLAKLEEEGLVDRIEEGRKALYRLTEAGRAEATRRAEEIADLEASLDDSAARLAEEMRQRVRAGAADLRIQVSEATARLREAAAAGRGAEDRDAPHGDPQHGGPQHGGAFDLDGLVSGLMAGRLPDTEAIARSVRRWAGASDSQAAGGRDDWAPSSPAPDPVATAATGDYAPASPPHRATPGEPVVPPSESSDRREHGPEGAFPSAAQMREVVAILKDAGERIQAVLERPRD